MTAMPINMTAESINAFAQVGILASLDRSLKDVFVLSVIVAELEFSNVERKIFLADLMKRADHAALEEGSQGRMAGWTLRRAADRGIWAPSNDTLGGEG